MKTNTICEDLIAFFEESDNYTINIKDTDVDTAYDYASNRFAELGGDIADYYPDFRENYKNLHARMEEALDVSRLDMPVINPEEIDVLIADALAGDLDKYKSNKMQISRSDDTLSGNITGMWLRPMQTFISTVRSKMPVHTMIPSQNQIWLDKVIEGTIRYGISKKEDLEKATMIEASDNYILDGHHRYANAMLLYPMMEIDTVKFSVDVKELIHILKAYSNARGKKPNL